MMPFKAGNIVRMIDKTEEGDRYVYGKITIIRDYEPACKVMFENSDLNYDYYYSEDLEFVKDKRHSTS
jgi:hypothetical protein